MLLLGYHRVVLRIAHGATGRACPTGGHPSVAKGLPTALPGGEQEFA